ncbi:hypothetical protein KKF91_08285 [Myxococcota bacterium]|nr:hypothetical protein [Myxococcota bacterium]MBU1430536.1 hypothetical protein [Myxococcota bacterium]MBU1899145.1 hypothetical protein [Myxococcota bacterium]
MNVNVRIMGLLRRPPDFQNPITLNEGACVVDLLTQLGYRERERRALRVDRAGAALGPMDPLKDQDQLVIYAMIGGG